jgi:plastocyanin
LTASNFAFDPTSLSAAAGGTIEFVNEDDAEHNITAEDAGIDEDVDAGATTTVDLGDVEPGTYDFICEYHPDTMTGTLEVTG